MVQDHNVALQGTKAFIFVWLSPPSLPLLPPLWHVRNLNGVWVTHEACHLLYSAHLLFKLF